MTGVHNIICVAIKKGIFNRNA